MKTNTTMTATNTAPFIKQPVIFLTIMTPASTEIMQNK